MAWLIALVCALALLPLCLGIARLPRVAPGASPWPGPGSVLFCALAFNLTFFWQELWLVIPKALTPGLSPVLYHNDHDWTGDAPIAELLQGTGAVATLVSGVAFLCLLARGRPSPAWRVFCFWMAFQGLFQSLSQYAIGAILPGNDVGRALVFLGADATTKALLLVVVAAAMGFVGKALALLMPEGLMSPGARGSRSAGIAMFVTAVGCVLLCVPFRVPRNPIEVVMIPAIVNLMGIGWLVFGLSFVRAGLGKRDDERIGWIGAAIALVVVLAVFQVVLRPGIRF